MRDITYEDEKLFKDIMDAFDNGYRTILIKGFDDEDKLFILLSAVRELVNMRGLNDVILRTNSYSHTSDLISMALSEYRKNKDTKIELHKDSKNIILGTTYRLDKWTGADNIIPLLSDISVYFPIQEAFSNIKEVEFNKLTNALEHDKSKFRILMTTTDYVVEHYDSNKLNDYIDKTFILDSSKKYPNTYKIILNNLGLDKLPYE